MPAKHGSGWVGRGSCDRQTNQAPIEWFQLPLNHKAIGQFADGDHRTQNRPRNGTKTISCTSLGNTNYHYTEHRRLRSGCRGVRERIHKQTDKTEFLKTIKSPSLADDGIVNVPKTPGIVFLEYL
ncbi:hypothetical protein EVAR_86793_1 [Eumeta japonica]|uniref:Uncharacterized protein n=1 Tax=Eumeta variegata TaxID=151549 RepID=A0A4C1VSZ6_EUMVA|nr:hypothetical protein EVAR_86793_1 [Eumeta japonica]